MLRNLENIWSKILVNSEEFAMFAVPKFYTSEMLCYRGGAARSNSQ